LHKAGAEHSIECRSTIERSDFMFDAIGSQQIARRPVNPDDV
jgi:hypothetical protein